jgi:hypothetical protein
MHTHVSKCKNHKIKKKKKQEDTCETQEVNLRKWKQITQLLPWAFWTGTLPLEPCSRPFGFRYFSDNVSWFWPRLDLDCNSPTYASQIAGITEVNPHAWPKVRFLVWHKGFLYTVTCHLFASSPILLALYFSSWSFLHFFHHNWLITYMCYIYLECSF